MDVTQLLPPLSEYDPLLEFESRLEKAARALDLEPWILQRLKYPEREIVVNLPCARDDASAINVSGYRVQHSRACGPCAGPIVLSPDARLATLRVTAATVTLQSALLGLRLGGAAGAIVCDAAQLSERTLRHLVRSYVSALREDIGPLSDIFVADEPRWLTSCLQTATVQAWGRYEPAAVIDGDLSRRVLSYAVTALIVRALSKDNVRGIRVALQGFGSRGQAMAEALQERGATLVGIADRSGGLMRRDGIDLAALTAYVQQNGVVFGFPGADAASNADVLEADCDVLVLAAAGRQVGAHNARYIRARLMMELTADAVTARSEMLQAGTAVVPYLIAGSAQVAGWSHEWQRGLMYAGMDVEAAAKQATTLALAAYDRAARLATDYEIPLAEAAVMAALMRLASAVRR